MALSHAELVEKAEAAGIDNASTMDEKELKKVYKNWTGEELDPSVKKPRAKRASNAKTKTSKPKTKTTKPKGILSRVRGKKK